MKTDITFEYPGVEIDYEFPERSRKVTHKGTLRPVQLDHEPYEVLFINEDNLCFHLVFGKMYDAQFLCIPFWNFGCEIDDLRNKLWNLDSILSIDRKFGIDDAVAITYALENVADLIN